MYLTNLYCGDCQENFEIEAEAERVQFCPSCAGQNISIHEQQLDPIDCLYLRVVDPIIADTELNFIEKCRYLDGLAEQMKNIAFRHKYGPLLKVLREIEHGW